MRKQVVLLVFALAAGIVLFQNCGGSASPSSAPESTNSASEVEYTPTEADVIEIAGLINLSGVDWANMTDSEIISEIIHQLEEKLASLGNSPADLALKQKIEQILDLIADSSELRAMIVQHIRTLFPGAMPTPTPSPSAEPTCGLSASPFKVPSNQDITINFNVSSTNASTAFISYWKGSQQIVVQAPLNGVKAIPLTASFSPSPAIIRFSVGVVSSSGQVRRCDTFVQFE